MGSLSAPLEEILNCSPVCKGIYLAGGHRCNSPRLRLNLNPGLCLGSSGGMNSQNSCQLPARLIAHFESYITTPGFQKAIKSEHLWMSCLLHDSLHWIISGTGTPKTTTLIHLGSQNAPQSPMTVMHRCNTVQDEGECLLTCPCYSWFIVEKRIIF